MTDKTKLRSNTICQKSYADKKQIVKEYKVGEHVFLRVKPKKRRLRTKIYAKLAPEILDRISPVAL